jgi:Mrp family chromosome partitioning ATPase/capsular polysaccharide biosynthesis protein
MLAMAGSGPGRILKPMNQTTDATAIFAPLWRRKWVILAVALLVAAGSYLYYKHQHSVYSATTEVYLGNGAEEQAQLGTGSGGKKATAPNPTTQAALINSSIVKEAVHDRLRRERNSRAVRAALKGKAKAKSSEKSEFLTITGEAGSARGAALLVNTTAQAYVKRQNAHYRRQVETAIALARKQLRKIEAGQLQSLINSASAPASKGSGTGKGSSGATATIQSATLTAKINQLESDLGISQVTQVNPAKPKASILVSPHPRSNALFGFAIGLVLAAFGAYALDRLDRRLRSLTAIEENFQTQVLTALRAVRNPLVVRDGHPAPAYVLREALWRLQTTLRVGSNGAGGEAVSVDSIETADGGGAESTARNGAENGRGRSPRTILCVGADAGDGVSTLVAALALAFGEAGERVAVVEADFRRPVQSGLLCLSGSHGLADVLTGMLGVEDAIQNVSFIHPEAIHGVPVPEPAGSAAAVVESVGSVSVLVGGTKVVNPPALLSRPATAELLRSLAEDYDRVLIDVPSPLQVSDAMPLLSAVDGIVIVARVGHTHEASAQRLVSLLRHTPSAPVLGVVANAVSPSEIKKYGIYTDAGQHRRGLRHALAGR